MQTRSAETPPGKRSKGQTERKSETTLKHSLLGGDEDLDQKSQGVRQKEQGILGGEKVGENLRTQDPFALLAF